MTIIKLNFNSAIVPFSAMSFTYCVSYCFRLILLYQVRPRTRAVSESFASVSENMQEKPSENTREKEQMKSVESPQTLTSSKTADIEKIPDEPENVPEVEVNYSFYFFLYFYFFLFCFKVSCNTV